MATKTDPTQAIRDAIENLRERVQPIENQIAEIRATAAKEVAALEAEVEDTREELRRWEDALAIAEGRTPVRRVAAAVGGRSPRGSTPGVTATQDELLLALEEADGPLSASQIRDALDIPSEVPSNKLTQFLAAALESGTISKQGEKRGTRYSVA